MATDDDDKRVKDVLGEGNLADLQRWFGLPSFTQLAEEGKAVEVPEDPEIKARRERQDLAMAAVEPWLLDLLERRHERYANPALQFEANLDVKVKILEPVDASMARIAVEPREVEIPEYVGDDLRTVTPQALLRDLHRVESYFDRRYEVYDEEAHQRFNVVGEVEQIMATNLRLLPDLSPGTDLRPLLAEVLEERAANWADLPKRYDMTNRRIVE